MSATDYTLILGTLVVNTPEGSATGYSLVGQRNDWGEPELLADVKEALERGGILDEAHGTVTRTLHFKCEAATASAALDKAVALRNALKPLEVITWRPDTTSLWRYATLRHATCKEAFFNPLLRAQGIMYLDVMLTTDPYWYGDEITKLNAQTIAIPGHADVSDVPGDMPALTWLKLTRTQTGGMLACGLLAGQEADTDQDYQGSTDYASYCKSGEAAKLTLSGSWQTFGTPDSQDAVQDAGRWIVIARTAQTDSTPADTTYRWVCEVSGVDITDTVTKYGDPVAATEVVTVNGFEVLILGDVVLPPATLPTSAPMSGWGASGTRASYATGTDLVPVRDGVAQTFALSSKTRIESLKLKLKETGSKAHSVVFELRDDVGDKPGDSVLASKGVTVSASTDGWVIATLDSVATVPAGEYSIGLIDNTDGQTLEVYHDTAAGYGSGAASYYIPAGNQRVAHWAAGMLKATEETLVSQTAGTLLHPLIGAAPGGGYYSQRVTESDWLWTEIKAKVKGDAATYYVKLDNYRDSVLFVEWTKTVVQESSIDGWLTWDLGAGEWGTLAPAHLDFSKSGVTKEIYYSDANPYAGGTVWHLEGGMHAHASEDLTFEVKGHQPQAADLQFEIIGQPRIGHDVTLGVQALNSGGGSGYLDTVGPIPVPCVVAVHNFSANQGIIVDELDPLGASDVYLTNSTAGAEGASTIYRTGGATYAHRRGQFKAPAGDSRLFINGDVSGNAVPGNATATLKVRPRWRMT